ncbi:AMP-binding protein [Paenibacillus cremeus]|uniref:acetate--CoA ligase n=1 Tax=Paenibacillus cremeus TaxID=2163881 RepID=A0A559KFQ5_9BACL|nr:AMP-binding protein [Paenibacillus cremeus]TVY10963.1 AMP-binding protein [Paenibacillus cremeus]
MQTKAVWHPEQAYIEKTRLFRFMQKFGYDDYDAFYKKSITDIDWFWNAVVQDMGIAWFRGYDRVVDLSAGIGWPSWFKGGQLNIAYTALEKWLGDEVIARRDAIRWVGENGEVSCCTYEELAGQVNRAANGLRKLGIAKGDRVVIYMPMLPETVISMLAVAKLGAIFTPVYSGYAAPALAGRMKASDAKMVITADGFYRRGSVIRMKEEADKALQSAAAVEKVVVVRRLGVDIPWQNGRDVEWTALTVDANAAANLQAEAMDSGDPLMLLYTSGTTGAPKGIVHTHSGFPIKAAFDAGYAMDFRPGDVMLWVTDMGWMMGPFLVFAALLNAGTMLLYEGSPDYPGPDRIWRLAHQHQVTHLGISPTLIRVLMQHGESGFQGCDLSALRVIGSTGEPWNLEPWLWLFQQVGKEQVPIFNYSGGTEISGGILGNVLLKPIAPVGFNTPIPGMYADVLDHEGKPIRGDVGELVLKAPWVGMASGFWQEPERYEAAYWSRWQDIWVHGDWVTVSDDGFWYITGRSDDTLNIAGKRLGPAEMETVLVGHPSVIEAATIGVPDAIKGEAAVCFVVPSIDISASSVAEGLVAQLVEWAAQQLGKALKPKAIHFVDALPKTRNGKVMRRVIRAAYLGEAPGDLSALDNPAAIQAIRQAGIHRSN